MNAPNQEFRMSQFSSYDFSRGQDCFGHSTPMERRRMSGHKDAITFWTGVGSIVSLGGTMRNYEVRALHDRTVADDSRNIWRDWLYIGKEIAFAEERFSHEKQNRLLQDLSELHQKQISLLEDTVKNWTEFAARCAEREEQFRESMMRSETADKT